MAKIRSIHPGLFSDEAFASVQPLARVLYIGILTECDDHGVFEWSPLGLKMKVLPGDHVSGAEVADLLQELSRFDLIKDTASGGRNYGLVRNFCKWQHPKKPSYRFPFTPEWAKYTFCKADCSLPEGITDPPQNPTRPAPSTPPETPQTTTGGEKSSLMEGKGREGKGEKKEPPPPAREEVSPKLSEANPLGSPMDPAWMPSRDTMHDAGAILVGADWPVTIGAFVMHHVAEGTLSRDWDASFLNHCRKAVPKTRKAKPRVVVDKLDTVAPGAPSVIRPAAVKLAGTIAHELMLKTDHPWRYSLPTECEVWLAGGIEPEFALLAIQERMVKRKGVLPDTPKYFRAVIAQARANLNATMPTVSPDKQEPSNGRRQGGSILNLIQADLDDLAREDAALRDRIEGEEAGLQQDTVRKLSG